MSALQYAFVVPIWPTPAALSIAAALAGGTTGAARAAGATPGDARRRLCDLNTVCVNVPRVDGLDTRRTCRHCAAHRAADAEREKQSDHRRPAAEHLCEGRGKRVRGAHHSNCVPCSSFAVTGSAVPVPL